jgi:hypothetical protein
LVAVTLALIALAGCAGGKSYSSNWREADWGSFQWDTARWAALNDCLDRVVLDIKGRGYSKALLVGIPDAQPGVDADSPIRLAQRELITKAAASGITLSVVESPRKDEWQAAPPADAVLSLELGGFGYDTAGKKKNESPRVRVTLRAVYYNVQTGKQIDARDVDGIGPKVDKPKS